MWKLRKLRRSVRVFDAQNNIIPFYPATVGSDEKPSPSGTLKVTKYVNPIPFIGTIPNTVSKASHNQAFHNKAGARGVPLALFGLAWRQGIWGGVRTRIPPR